MPNDDTVNVDCTLVPKRYREEFEGGVGQPATSGTPPPGLSEQGGLGSLAPTLATTTPSCPATRLERNLFLVACMQHVQARC